MAEVLIANSSRPDATTEPTLKRVMGRWLLPLFIIGDLLGTGIYTLTGEVAEHVGGAVWLPFLLAVVVALLTAFSYIELVTKYPRAASAALYVHKAFNLRFITFIVGFAVMCSGVTSASTAARAFAANLSDAFRLDLSAGIGITLVGLAYIVAVAAINFRGLSESLSVNVMFTSVEMTGLLIIIFIGLWAGGLSQGDVSRITEFKPSADGSIILPVITATTFAFFAMIGFEDSVNMVEEVKEPTRISEGDALRPRHYGADLCAGVGVGSQVVVNTDVGQRAGERAATMIS